MIRTFLKPMLPTLAEELPKGENWVYEVKYDGFRCQLYWDHSTVIMTSRNGHHLHEVFPEIPNYLKGLSDKLNLQFPVLFDGELCILENSFKASFEQIQKRGRLKQREKILTASNSCPSSFCAFDLLACNAHYLYQEPFSLRKEKLKNICEMMGIHADKVSTESFFNFVPAASDLKTIHETVRKHKSEGIVAKTVTSKWSAGTRTTQWIKVKNLKVSTFILLGYDQENGFFHVGVLNNGNIKFVGLFAHGISPQEKEALIQIIKKNQSAKSGSLIIIEPSLCVDLSYLELYKEQIRQPRFLQFRFDADWEDCTWESLQKNS